MINKQFLLRKTIKIFSILLFIFINLCALAENRVVNLHVGYKIVKFSGCPSKAVAVNNQIPAPTLHFKEGDCITINVYNHLDKGTSRMASHP